MSDILIYKLMRKNSWCNNNNRKDPKNKINIIDTVIAIAVVVIIMDYYCCSY